MYTIFEGSKAMHLHFHLSIEYVIMFKVDDNNGLRPKVL
jgi:hypothetical protein